NDSRGYSSAPGNTTIKTTDKIRGRMQAVSFPGNRMFFQSQGKQPMSDRGNIEPWPSNAGVMRNPRDKYSANAAKACHRCRKGSTRNVYLSRPFGAALAVSDAGVPCEMPFTPFGAPAHSVYYLSDCLFIRSPAMKFRCTLVEQPRGRWMARHV